MCGLFLIQFQFVLLFGFLCANVRNKINCECAHSVSGHGIGCQAVRTPYIYSDKHTSARKEIKISPPNLSEGGLLRSPIILLPFSSFF